MLDEALAHYLELQALENPKIKKMVAMYAALNVDDDNQTSIEEFL